MSYPQYFPNNAPPAAKVIPASELMHYLRNPGTYVVTGIQIETVELGKDNRGDVVVITFTGSLLKRIKILSAENKVLDFSYSTSPNTYIRLADYSRCLEPGDLLDVALEILPGPKVIPLMFWLTVHYEGTVHPSSLYAKKHDGLFAYRTKAGEKAERLVAALLRDHGHPVHARYETIPRVFIISPQNKRKRKTDLTCPMCGLRVEVKKRNFDCRIRPSHSETRPFWDENRDQDYHAFVFWDNTVHFFKNSDIAEAIRQGKGVPGREGRLDAYFQIYPNVLSEVPLEQLPPCRS